MIAAIEPAIAAGVAIVRTHSYIPKGCPGGKPRPATYDVAELELTPDGRVAVAALYPAVDAWRAAQDAAVRADLLARIAEGLPRLDATRVRYALVAGECGSTEQLASRTTDQLHRIVQVVERA